MAIYTIDAYFMCDRMAILHDKIAILRDRMPILRDTMAQSKANQEPIRPLIHNCSTHSGIR